MIQVQLKLRLRPAHERQLERWLFRLTGAYNWAVRKIEADARSGKFYSAFDMKALVVGHGAKAGVPGDALDRRSTSSRRASPQRSSLLLSAGVSN